MRLKRKRTCLVCLAASQQAAAQTLVPATAGNSSFASTSVNVVQLDADAARYGHTVVVLPLNNTLLVIGGQSSTNATVSITSSVISLDLTANFSRSSFNNSTTTPPTQPNPSLNSSVSTNLVPNAWSTSAVDSDGAVWLIGGVPNTCGSSDEQDSRVQVLRSPDQGWLSLDITRGVVPPRRRQAKAVAVKNEARRETDILVFGGVTDGYTCSDQLRAYEGIDRYSPARKTVEVIPWRAPVNLPPKTAKGFEPAVGDFSATAINEGRNVILMGGQLANGSFVNTSHVLDFNVTSERFKLRSTTGTSPGALIGHSATHIKPDGVLVHGGLNESLVVTGSSFLLNTTTWSWKPVALASGSMAPPALVWHSANEIMHSSIAFAFGIDEQGQASNAFMFLTRHDNETWSWQDNFTPISPKRKTPAKVQILPVDNPKFDVSSSVSPPEPEWTPSTAVYTTPSPTTWAKPTPLTSYVPPMKSQSSTIIPRPTPVTTPASDSSPPTESIVAGVSSVAGLALVAAAAFFFVRRRRKAGAEEDDDSRPSTPATMSGAPAVSALLFTRKSQIRALSLGSTMSERGSTYWRDDAASTIRGGDDHDEYGGEMRGRDPFGDEYAGGADDTTNEFGRMTPSLYSRPSGSSGTIRPPERSMTKQSRAATDVASIGSPAMSVQSQPYLRALFRTDSLFGSYSRDRARADPFADDEQDRYTTVPSQHGHADRQARAGYRTFAELETLGGDGDATGRVRPRLTLRVANGTASTASSGGRD